MDTEQLQAFIAAVDKGSFSSAADYLNITQPAISKRISSLEKKLGTTLFEREQRKIYLTAAGSTLLPRARKILDELNNATESIKSLNKTVSGALNIVASHHIGLHWLPAILKIFTQKYPQVKLQLTFKESEQAYQSLVRNEADIAFITLATDNLPNFKAHLVLEDPMNFVCSEDHPLANIDEPSIKDIAEYDAVLPAQNTLTFSVVEQIFKQGQVDLKAAIPTNYLETIKMMVSVGMGWSVLPNTMIDEYLKVLKLGDTEISRKLGIISRKDKLLSNAAVAFIDEARRYH